MTHLFERSEVSEDDQATPPTRSRSQSIDFSSPDSPSQLTRSRSGSIQSDISLAESDTESVDSTEDLRIDWSAAEPLDVLSLLPVTPHQEESFSHSSEGSEDNYMTVKEAPIGLSGLFVEDHVLEEQRTVKPKPHVLPHLNVPIVQDVFQAADIASEGMEDMAQVKSRNGSMVLIKRSQLAEWVDSLVAVSATC